MRHSKYLPVAAFLICLLMALYFRHAYLEAWAWLCAAWMAFMQAKTLEMVDWYQEQS